MPILPLDCSTDTIVASTVDGNYTYIGFASDSSGSDFSEVFNTSLHTYKAILTSEVEIPSRSYTDYAGLWVPIQGQYTYSAFATSSAGAGYSATYTGAETWAAVISSATKITSPSASNFTGKWFPIGNASPFTAENILTFKNNRELFPITPFLIKNVEMDNTKDTTDCTPITVSSIDTTNNTITLSWVPNIDSIFDPSTDKEWILFDLDTASPTELTSSNSVGGYYLNVFKLTSGDYATKTFNYNWIGSGTETDTVTTNKVAFWNPDVDGFTRYTGNPILDISDFQPGCSGSYNSVSTTGGIFQHSDGTYRMIVALTPSGGSYSVFACSYATSSNLLDWTASQNEIFTLNRPTWANTYLWPQGNPCYLKEEDRYLIYGTGQNAAGDRQIGWIKFDENFGNVEYSTDPVIDTDVLDALNLEAGWKTGGEIAGRSDIHSFSFIENNGLWYCFMDVIGAYSGTHSGTSNSATLTDTARTVAFINGEFGAWNVNAVYNVTDGSSCTNSASISVTSNVVTAPLSGGSENDWDNGDAYLIYGLNTRRHVYGTASSPYGPWSNFKVMEKENVDNDGSVGNCHAEPGELFIYNGCVHCFADETSATDYSGVRGKRIISLFRLDESTGEFKRHVKSPVFASWQYANVARTSAACHWEMYHIGGKVNLYSNVAENRLYLYYSAKGPNSNQPIDYCIGVAYRDLGYYLQ